MAPIKVGLLGYGNSAKYFHLPFILPNPNLQLYAFLQRKEAPTDRSNTGPGIHCTIDYPEARHYRTADEFFADDQIELVIVCTHHDTHFEFAKKALLSGKHVVVEKPFTVTSQDADQLIALSKTVNKILTVYQNRRYDSDFRTLQHLYQQGVFGRVTEFQNYYDIDNAPWMTAERADPYAPDSPPGGGMMYGLGTHSLDQTLVLFGRPKSVTAFTRVLRAGGKVKGKDFPKGCEDTFTIVLQYDDDGKGTGRRDLVCTIKTTIVSPAPLERMLKFWVRGTEGVFIKNGEDVQIEQIREKGMKTTDPDYGLEPAKYYGYLSTKKKLDDPSVSEDGTVTSHPGSYVDYYKDVVAAIRGEKEIFVKPEESRDGIRIIELAKESAAKGITVPWS